MSKNITISEGNTARAFGNTKKLETKLQGEDAGSCFWVPEDETEAQPLYITENGMHEASEEKVYGFSEVHVNIPQKGTDGDGIDWIISIDDGTPVIDIDNPDGPIQQISIDPETGNPTVTLEDVPITDLGIEEIHIPDVDIGTGEDVDIDITVDLETGDIDVTIDGEPIEDLGMDEILIESIEIPGVGIGDIEITIDPETGDIDVTADVDVGIDPEEADLDPDKDVDVAFDPDDQDVDMVGTDVDGNDAAVDYDPETGEIVKTVLAAEIRVTTPPTKTAYTDGETIDYSGIIVNAYYADGTFCKTVPMSELILPAEQAIFDEEKYTKEKYEASSNLIIWPFDQPIGFTTGSIAYYKSTAETETPYNILNASTNCKIVCFFYHKQTMQSGEEVYPGYVLFASVNEFTVSQTIPIENRRASKWTYKNKSVYYAGLAVVMFVLADQQVDYQPQTNAKLIENAVFSGIESQKVAWTIVHGDITYEPGGAKQTIPIYWQRPCDGAVLQTAFDVVVNQAEGGD